MRNGTTRVLAPWVGATLVLLGLPAAVAGACDGPEPSFREAAPSAQTIVVGTVVETMPADDDPIGYASTFELRVDHVLRGRADALLRVSDLKQSGCSGVLVVPDGAVIALALDAQAFTPPMDVNAVAFIQGISWRESIGGIGPAERLTLQEVFSAAGVPMPDTAMAPGGVPAWSWAGAAAHLSATVAYLALRWRRHGGHGSRA